MLLEDEGQIRALYILLSNLKYTVIDSSDIFRFVPTSKIDEVHELLRNRLYDKITESKGIDFANQWLLDTSFKFGSEESLNITNKIDKWDKTKCLYYKNFNNSQLEELARSFIKPFDNSPEEVSKLVEFIKNKIDASCL